MDPTITADAGAVQAASAAITSLNDEIDPGTGELVQQWRNRLDQAFRHDEAARTAYEDDRRVARGDTTWLVDTNLVGAILEVLEAHVYAKDPDFLVQVSESVRDTRVKLLGEAIDTIRIVGCRLLKDAGLKKKAKRQVKSSMTVGVGWLRPSLTTHTVKDPIVLSQINTLQENLARVAVLEQNLADGEAAEPDAARAEIEANIVALQAKLEKTVATGLVLDLFPAEDVQVSPECGELVNYLDSPWIKYRTYKTREEAQAITGWNAAQIAKANIYTQKRATGGNGEGSNGQRQLSWVRVQDANAQTADGFVAFDEVWSKRDGVVYTLIDGVNDRWARAPYAPMTGARWYDCFLLPCHTFDGERHPQSDVHQLKRLQDEYGRTRSNFAETRKRSIPVNVWDASAVSSVELKKISSAEAGENVAVEFTSTNGQPISQSVFRAPTPVIDPAVYATQPITQDMEKVSGAQDAMQSGVSAEKTATEAQIQNSGFGARIGTRRDTLEEMLGELFEWTVQVALQYLPEDTVIKIAGPAAVWPQLSVDEVMCAYDISVKAGSTGKPNQEAERAAWATILPLLENLITVVGNFRAQGPQMEWAAEPYVQMLKETFRVLGKKDDVDKFLPKPPPPMPVDPAAAALAAVTGADPAAIPGAAPAGPVMSPVLSNIGTPDSTPGSPAPTT